MDGEVGLNLEGFGEGGENDQSTHEKLKELLKYIFKRNLIH